MTNKVNEKVSNKTENGKTGVITIGTPPKAAKQVKNPRRNMSRMQIKRHMDTDNGNVRIIKAKGKREPLPVAMIVTIVAITLLALFMMMNFAELESANASINELENQLTKLKTEKKELEVQLEKAEDLTFIEQYARDVLGMEKPNKKFPISLLPTDSTDIMQYPDEEVHIETIFSGFGDVFRSFLLPKE